MARYVDQSAWWLVVVVVLSLHLWASRRRRSVGVGPTDDLPASFLGMKIFNYCEAGRQADLKRSNECSGNNRN